MKLQSILMGGAVIIVTLLLANLLNALAPDWSPFVPTGWVTFSWHMGLAVLVAIATGYFTGLLMHFIYMIDNGTFDARDKQKAYEYSYIAFFTSIGILLTASLFGDNAFKTASIIDGAVVIIMALVVFVLPKAFGRGIDQGGTASLGVHQHAQTAPAAPAQQAQNNDDGFKIHPFATMFIAIFVIIVLLCFFSSPAERHHKKDQSTDQADKGDQKSSHDGSDQKKPTPPRYSWEKDETSTTTATPPNQKIVWDAATEQAEQKADNDFLNSPPSYQTKDWNDDKKPDNE